MNIPQNHKLDHMKIGRYQSWLEDGKLKLYYHEFGNSSGYRETSEGIVREQWGARVGPVGGECGNSARLFTTRGDRVYLFPFVFCLSYKKVLFPYSF